MAYLRRIMGWVVRKLHGPGDLTKAPVCSRCGAFVFVLPFSSIGQCPNCGDGSVRKEIRNLNEPLS